MSQPPPPIPRPMTRREEVLAQLNGLELPMEDGQPMDSDWHRIAMVLLIDLINTLLAPATDYYVGGNMFIHYSVDQVRNRDFLGPDVFFVRGRPRQPPRLYWAVWEEEFRYPNVIFELVSPTTEDNDRGKKFRIYEQIFRTPEYFIYDPASETLNGYRLGEAGSYEALPLDESGRMWSEQLGAFIGPWRGEHANFNVVWLRLFTRDGELVPTAVERARFADQRADELALEVQRLRDLLSHRNGSANGS